MRLRRETGGKSYGTAKMRKNEKTLQAATCKVKFGCGEGT